MTVDLSKVKAELEGNLIEEKVNTDLEIKVEEGLENLSEGEEKEDELVTEPEEELDDGDEPVVKKEEIVLPDNYYRAAKHQGWNDEEIQSFFDSNPEKAIETFGKIYDSTNFITSQTAALGRAHIQTQKNLEESTKQKSQPKVLDVEKLRQRIGDDDPASLALLDAMVEQNAILAEQIGELRQTSRPTQMTDEESRIWGSINTFFNDPDTQLYGDLYGKTDTKKDWGSSLTGEEMKSRMSLIEQADQIRAGAMLQGKDMDYSEALQRAHLVVSDSMKEKVVRTKIVGQLQRRNDGITVRSTVQKQRSQEDDNGPPSEKKAVSTVRKGLKKLFGGYVE